ncbi:hypothetical protein JOY44_07565 [Phormidium sp. CLA17]|uniref:hypothetical protein n=1 Tax=Leptolyngbya sp. Cla-17 TaxID=2803751 RepID=UPI001490A121|nr:hypothetical protein [Leptolyngbya sp. Cla-17]MBM0741472.1 hypothetical protein [Leptolyngbya sp. Cla-17]
MPRLTRSHSQAQNTNRRFWQRTAWIVTSAFCATAAGIIKDAIVPMAAQAVPRRTNVMLDVRAGETYDAFIQRATTAAKTATQGTFNRNSSVSDLSVVVTGQNQGSTVQVLTLRANRNQWRSNPSGSRWATYYPTAQSLLGLAAPVPVAAIPVNVQQGNTQQSGTGQQPGMGQPLVPGQPLIVPNTPVILKQPVNGTNGTPSTNTIGSPTQFPTNAGSPAQFPTTTGFPTPTGSPTQFPTPTGSPNQFPTNAGSPAQVPTTTGFSTPAGSPTQFPTNTGSPTQFPINTGSPFPTNTGFPTSTGSPTNMGFPANTISPTQFPTTTGFPAQFPTNAGSSTQSPTTTGFPTNAGSSTQFPTNAGSPTQFPTNTGFPTPTGLPLTTTPSVQQQFPGSFPSQTIQSPAQNIQLVQ